MTQGEATKLAGLVGEWTAEAARCHPIAFDKGRAFALEQCGRQLCDVLDELRSPATSEASQS